MQIREKLLRFKFHLVSVVVASAAVFSVIHFAPRLADVVAYFWPLLLSTAVSLFAAVILARTSPPVAEGSGEKAGEQILDYVAGKPEVTTTATSGGD